MPLIKICGIRELEHASVAAEAGANLIGFVFVPVRRQIQPADANQIIDGIRKRAPRPPAAIGLFVNAPADTINSIVAQAGLDLVQLSGNEAPELAREIDVPVIKAIRIGDDECIDDLRDRIRHHLQYACGVVIDSHVAGQWGGTGVVGDWETARTLAAEFPVVLAGGLSPENVGDAIERVQPAIVDVSSGVETDGRKDEAKIRMFIDAAKRHQRPVDPSSLASAFVEHIESIQQKFVYRP